ncbi:MAG: hypothetical protein IT370_24920 [Deltaproteobacteria bacterium]|nr:hypothetical protein [Deltaproteobacteria bacterium]
MKRMHTLLTLWFALSLAACGGSKNGAKTTAPPSGMLEIAGFAAPESALYVADGDYYLISNVNGGPGDVDDNGFISKLGADGKIIALRWIDGAAADVTLSAPKGMGIRAGKLYVTDLDHVRVFDMATGKPAATPEIALEGATFLNDIAVQGDQLVVSDTGVDAKFAPTGAAAVWSIDSSDAPTKLIGGDLEGPNGVAISGGQVWVAPFGGKHLYRVDGEARADLTELGAGSLDGLVMLADGRILVSSWEAKGVFLGKAGGPFTQIVSDVGSPADIEVDVKRNRLVVPNMMGNSVRFYPLK